MRSFESIWKDIKATSQGHLKSRQPIFTLEKNVKNYITAVTEDYIERDSTAKRSGAARRVRRKVFKDLYELLVTYGSVKAVDTKSLSFSHSLMALLPEVSVSYEPLTLCWNPEISRCYYLIGSKYGSTNSMLDKMASRSVVSVGFHRKDLSHVYSRSEYEIVKYLKSRGEEPKSYNAIKKFLQLKPGDIVAVKEFASPLGKMPRLAIGAYAIVVERDGVVYYYDPSGLFHCVNVEFIDIGFREFERGGFGQTVHRVEKQEDIQLLFSGYLAGEDQLIRSKIKRRKREGARHKNTGIEVRKGHGSYIANLRHNSIQVRYAEYLVRLYGRDKVRMESNFVDITVDLGDKLLLFEVKKAFDAEACIKEGLGQILAYGFFSEDKREKEFTIVGPSTPDEEELDFIRYLNKSFGMRVNYQAFP